MYFIIIFVKQTIKQEIMKGIFKIGTVSTNQILKMYKAASREMELEDSTGWTSKHKVHKSSKNYNRKAKHMKLEF